MKHDPTAFGRNFDRAGWYLRALAEHRRSARRTALGFGGAAVALAFAGGVAMALGSEGGAALFGLGAALAACIATAAASEA